MHVVVWMKDECPLCDDVVADLGALSEEFSLTIESRSILEDDALFERFRYLIPVVEIDGGVLHYPPHDWLSLRAAFVTAGLARSGENGPHGTA